MTVVAPTRTQAERADLTRSRILEAALAEFSSSGLAGARTDQIAAAAGVNKALLYYYFNGKEALYEAALETAAEGVQAASMAILDADSSAGQRFLQMVLNHFDRIHSNLQFQSLMQQEMIRLHKGEQNSLALLAEKLFRPLWLRVKAVVEEGIAAGELIPVEWSQIIFAGLGANVFYFLSAPMTRLSLGFDPLERPALVFRRSAAINYLGQAIFVDRKHGAELARKVLAATQMPQASGSGGAITHPPAKFFSEDPGEGERGGLP